MSLLKAALLGYEAEKQRIEQAIADIQAELGRKTSQRSGVTSKRTRRPMTAAARKRIAAAQKKRWAAYRKAKAA